LSSMTPDRRRLHTLFSKQRRNRQKTARNTVDGHDFKPIAGRVRLTAKPACDYTK
jgi:hypothetical protein